MLYLCDYAHACVVRVQPGYHECAHMCCVALGNKALNQSDRSREIALIFEQNISIKVNSVPFIAS